MNKDRNSLLIICYTLACIALFAISRYIGKNVNAWIVFVIIIVLQQLYVIPKLVKNYSALHGQYAGIGRFIPLWNEMMILPPYSAIWTCITTALFALGAGAMFINLDILLKVFPYSFAASWADRCIIFCIVMEGALCLVRGAGYLAVVRQIGYANEEFIGPHEKNKWSFVEKLAYIGLFIPGLRALSLVFQLPTLTKLVELNDNWVDYADRDVEYEEY